MYLRMTILLVFVLSACTGERISHSEAIDSGHKSVTSTQFQTGLVAYQNNDYNAAVQSWSPLAEQGDPRAQAGLGILYATGKGLEPDLIQAYAWDSGVRWGLVVVSGLSRRLPAEHRPGYDRQHQGV